MTEKLQKVLANAGLGSRRKMEEVIAKGRVFVNGKRAELGCRVEASDRIELDGERIKVSAPSRTRVLLYAKPDGEICTRDDPGGRPTVFANLPHLDKGRWIAVGRLDVNTSGLLLFTNDGELANQLMHPSSEIEREYCARVYGQVQKQDIQKLIQGIELEDGFARFKKVTAKGKGGKNQWFNVVITEGRKREVRRLWEALDYSVSRLIRIRFGPIELPRLMPTGTYKELKSHDVMKLKSGQFSQ